MAARAMIVEDEKDLCYLLSLHLKRENVQTSCAHTLEEAKANIPTINPSFVLLDNNLPDGVGTDIIQDIKTHNPETKVIMITAHDHPTVVQTAFKNGADYFISKPLDSFAIQDMLATIKAIH